MGSWPSEGQGQTKVEPRSNLIKFGSLTEFGVWTGLLEAQQNFRPQKAQQSLELSRTWLRNTSGNAKAG